MKEITSGELKEVTNVEDDRLKVIKFYADWCAPCKAFAPIVEEVWSELTEVDFFSADVDVDENMELAQKYGVRSIPSLLFFKNGEYVDSQMGSSTKEELEEKCLRN